MRGKVRRAVLAFIIFSVVSVVGAMQEAESMPVTFKFDGVVNYVHNAQFNFLNGERISGTYTFESTTPDSNTASSMHGNYVNAVTDMSVSIGSHYTGVLANPASIGVDASWQYQFYTVHFPVLWSGPGSTTSSTWLSLILESPPSCSSINPQRCIFTSDALPVTELIPQYPWSSYSTGRIIPSGGAPDFKWNLTSVTPAPAPVPEPGTLLLVGTGLAGLAGFSKKYKANRHM